MRTLSEDIHLVGDTLGAVLRALSGEEVFAREEEMRLYAKRARETPDDARCEEARCALQARARALEADEALEVVRAFMLYFQLVNVAEDEARVRELRRREGEGGADSVAESLAASARELDERGVSRVEALAALSELQLRFVFTAHPTEARRRTTERLLLSAREVLEHLDRVRLLPKERADEELRLRAAVEALWTHATERTGPPAVLDEVKAGLWYFEQVLLDVVPQVQRRLREAFERRFGPIDALELPSVVSFGSWMGADRDGNPFVTDAATERALALSRHLALSRYARDLWGLVDELAGLQQRLPEDAAFEEAMARAARAVPEVVPEAERRNPEEPLRRMLTYVHERLMRSLRFGPGGYRSPDELLADLVVTRGLLARAGAIALADDRLLDLIERVRCFGFLVAPLDVREDARVHRRVVGELLSDPAYPARSDAERRRALGSLVVPSDVRGLSAEARRLLDLFSSLAKLQPLYGASALGTYIISRTESPADVLEVLALAEAFGVARSLDVVPLLESRAALEGGGDLVAALLDDEAYRAHVAQRGDVQEVLVGYSDSMKEAGLLASRVKVRAAQQEIAEVCRRRDVCLRLFHGRGGSVSRGGGPTYRAIRALPRDAFTGRMKLTEQGETRAFHFGNPHLAERYLEQTLGAAWIARCEARGSAPTAAITMKDDDLWARLTEGSFHAYRELVEDPGLFRYFDEATPYRSIAALHIGSRPQSRAQETTGLDALRAIPWVFAWSQCRAVLPGWYGVGAALEQAHAQGDAQRLRSLYQADAFFRDLVDNVASALAKSDLAICARYAELCSDDAVRERIFGRIREEHARSVRAVLEVTGQAALLDDDPVLQRSIRLRNPYVDPLSYLQVEALKKVRAATSDDERARWARVSRGAVQGIAAGLRHTG